MAGLLPSVPDKIKPYPSRRFKHTLNPIKGNTAAKLRAENIRTRPRNRVAIDRGAACVPLNQRSDIIRKPQPATVN